MRGEPKMKKRITAAVLALCLVLALLPAGALAAGDTKFTYTVTVTPTKGGTVTVSETEVEKYTLINVTAKPDYGYVLESLTVTGPKGENVELTKKSNTQYSFTMPWGPATVTAVFQAEDEYDPSTDGALPFTDVAENAWYHDAVQYVYSKGMMNGTSDTLFAPNTNLNRAMIAQVLYNLENTPAWSASVFVDVPHNAWYANAVNWAAGQSIVTGYGNNTFGPMNNITREQVAAILYRYAQHKDYIWADRGDLTAYVDGASVSSWAKDAVAWAVGQGILSGKSGNRLDPTGTATRAEVAQILTNFCQRFVK
jgi:hypothetical protein